MQVRILFIEDSPDDAALAVRRLVEGGLEPQWDRVQNEDGVRRALADGHWDVALVDYNMPGFGGPEALSLLARVAPDLPAITMSGSIDEETAVATITAGAVDYVLKDNLTRLAPAVRRAVEGAALRRRHRRAADSARLAMYAVDNASQAAVTLAEDGTVLYVNEAACRLVALTRREAVGHKVWEYYSRLDEDSWPLLWNRVRENGTVEMEGLLNGTDGEHVLDLVLNYLEHDGTAYVISWARDITDRLAAEAAAKESQQLYQRIIETAAEGVWALDRELRTTFVNAQMARMLGYEPDELLGRRLDDFVFAEDLADHEAQMSRRRKGEGARYERRWRRKDGSELWTLVSAAPEIGPGGEFLGTFGMLTDVTERRAVEVSLRESEERFEQFAQRVPGYVYMKDDQLRYLFINQTEIEDQGLEGVDWRGKTGEELWSASEAAELRAIGEQVLAGEVLDLTDTWETKRGPRTLHSLTFPILREGKPPILAGLSLDVTEQVESQAAAQRTAERLRRTLEGAVLAMSHVVETRDPYTAGHERRVSELATAMAEEMGMAGDDLTGLRLAGLIHDIGKIAVPAEILAKPGRLSAVEFDLIKQHPQAGYDILEPIEFDRPVALLVVQHHERLDGSGYPRGLKADDITLEARILAVADVVEAMSSHRPYRPALGMDAALAEIREGAGTRYDAEAVLLCCRVVEEKGFTFTP